MIFLIVNNLRNKLLKYCHIGTLYNANHLPKRKRNMVVRLTLWQQPSSFWTALLVLLAWRPPPPWGGSYGQLTCELWDLRAASICHISRIPFSAFDVPVENELFSSWQFLFNCPFKHCFAVSVGRVIYLDITVRQVTSNFSDWRQFWPILTLALKASVQF